MERSKYHPYCWIKGTIYNVDLEEDPARFATKNCEFRMGDGVFLDERFECEHPEAENVDDYSEFCELSKRSSSGFKTE